MMKSRSMRWAGHVARRNVYRVWIGEPEGKTPLGGLRHRWDDDRMDCRETLWGCGLD
jgi:hypothetical protein